MLLARRFLSSSRPQIHSLRPNYFYATKSRTLTTEAQPNPPTQPNEAQPNPPTQPLEPFLQRIIDLGKRKLTPEEMDDLRAWEAEKDKFRALGKRVLDLNQVYEDNEQEALEILENPGDDDVIFVPDGIYRLLGMQPPEEIENEEDPEKILAYIKEQNEFYEASPIAGPEFDALRQPPLPYQEPDVLVEYNFTNISEEEEKAEAEKKVQKSREEITEDLIQEGLAKGMSKEEANSYAYRKQNGWLAPPKWFRRLMVRSTLRAAQNKLIAETSGWIAMQEVYSNYLEFSAWKHEYVRSMWMKRDARASLRFYRDMQITAKTKPIYRYAYKFTPLVGMLRKNVEDLMYQMRQQRANQRAIRDREHVLLGIYGAKRRINAWLKRIKKLPKEIQVLPMNKIVSSLFPQRSKTLPPLDKRGEAEDPLIPREKPKSLTSGIASVDVKAAADAAVAAAAANPPPSPSTSDESESTTPSDETESENASEFSEKPKRKLKKLLKPDYMWKPDVTTGLHTHDIPDDVLDEYFEPTALLEQPTYRRLWQTRRRRTRIASYIRKYWDPSYNPELFMAGFRKFVVPFLISAMNGNFSKQFVFEAFCTPEFCRKIRRIREVLNQKGVVSYTRVLRIMKAKTGKAILKNGVPHVSVRIRARVLHWVEDATGKVISGSKSHFYIQKYRMRLVFKKRPDMGINHNANGIGNWKVMAIWRKQGMFMGYYNKFIKPRQLSRHDFGRLYSRFLVSDEQLMKWTEDPEDNWVPPADTKKKTDAASIMENMTEQEREAYMTGKQNPNAATAAAAAAASRVGEQSSSDKSVGSKNAADEADLVDDPDYGIKWNFEMIEKSYDGPADDWKEPPESPYERSEEELQLEDERDSWNTDLYDDSPLDPPFENISEGLYLLDRFPKVIAKLREEHQEQLRTRDSFAKKLEEFQKLTLEELKEVKQKWLQQGIVAAEEVAQLEKEAMEGMNELLKDEQDDTEDMKQLKKAFKEPVGGQPLTPREIMTTAEVDRVERFFFDHEYKKLLETFAEKQALDTAISSKRSVLPRLESFGARFEGLMNNVNHRMLKLDQEYKQMIEKYKADKKRMQAGK